MKKRSIILYWLLLLVPTLLITVAAFQMLRHEQKRINEQARSSALDRVRAIADTVKITVADVEDGLTEALRRIPPTRLISVLSTWETRNPLIRNVFVWRPKRGLQYPQKAAPLKSEERRFIGRYEALFSGRVPWRSGGVEKPDKGPDLDQTSPQKARSNLVRQVQKLERGRKRLTGLAKGETVNEAGRPADSQKDSRGLSGWIPWFEENRLYILGWVQQGPNGPVYGVELELMTLLSRLVTDFPSEAPQGMVYALVDGRGRVLHQAGNGTLDSGAAPDLTSPLAPYLPHWQLAVYFSDGGLAARSDKGFLLLAGLLLAIFFTAIVLGGSLLTWQAHRNMTDARQKTSFVSNVSHELKTPLTSIRMYAELLNEGRIKGKDKKKKYLETIVAESQRLTRLVNNVLDFSRLEQGRRKYHLEELELAGYLRELAESHRLRLKETGLALKIQIPEQDMIIHTDRDALEQVMLNLLDNVIKYAAGGGELVIALSEQADGNAISVMDRGPGVLPAHRVSIFEKFHRVDDSLTAQQPGSGLGLSIAKRLMRGLGGDLLYEPRDGGGSCFVVVIVPLGEWEKNPRL